MKCVVIRYQVGTSMNPSNQQPEQPGWPALVMKELVSISERHSVVVVIATILLILLEVEATEG